MMNAVFSLISSPKDIKHSINNFLNNRDSTTAASLSVLCAKRNLMHTILYSDEKSAEALYSNGVYFDQYNHSLADKNIPGEWWTMGKIETYGMQTHPFLHIDGDAFLFDRVQENQVICQGLDFKLNYYQECVSRCKEAGCKFPDYFEDFIQIDDYSEICYNTGVFGGSNVKATYDYAQSALKFVKDNNGAWEKLKNVKNESSLFAIQEICVMVEQLFMTAYMRSINQKVTCIVPDGANFIKSDYSYIHLAGGFKKQPVFIGLMHEKMRSVFPGEYQRILEKYS